MKFTKKITEHNELMLYLDGKLIYKKWMNTGESKVFDIFPYDKYTSRSITLENLHEFDEDLPRYLIKNYQHLMNLDEKVAHRNFSLDYKLEKGNPKSLAYQKKIKSLQLKTLNSRKLMEGGWDHFLHSWIVRILKENFDQIKLNRCSECSRLTRTPKSKQCRYCGNDWH